MKYWDCAQCYAMGLLSIPVCNMITTLLSVNKMKWGFEYWFWDSFFFVLFFVSDKKMIWNRWNFPHVFIFQLFKSNWSHFLFDFILIFLYNISPIVIDFLHRKTKWEHFQNWFPKLLFCYLREERYTIVKFYKNFVMQNFKRI